MRASAVRTHGDIVVSQPRHAAPGDPAASHQVGAVLRGAAVRRDRRAAHLPRRVRLARREPRPAAAADLPVLRVEPGLHRLLGDDRAIPASWPSALLGGPVRAVTERGAPQGRKHFAGLEPAGAQRRPRHPRLGALAVDAHRPAGGEAGPQDHRLRQLAARGRGADEVPEGRVRPRSARAGARRRLSRRLSADRAPRTRKRSCARAGSTASSSTSALELGVDIGALDVCVLNGYPGTVAGDAGSASGGPAGEAAPPSACSCARSDPLDQYLVRHPGVLPRCEPRARADRSRPAPDPAWTTSAARRSSCRSPPARRFGGVKLEEALGYLAEQGVVHREGPRWHWIADSYPANAVSPALDRRGQLHRHRHHRRQQGRDRRGRLLGGRGDALRRRDPHGAVGARGRSRSSTGSGARRS